MAEPARGSAADQAEIAAWKPDPRAEVWADVRRAIITDSHAVALAAAEVAARPGDTAALEMLGLTTQAMESAVAIAGGWEVKFAVIEEERKRAYEQGVADCKAARCRLGVVGGGRAG